MTIQLLDHLQAATYIVFDEVFGRSFTLTATPTIGNPASAPINAIEIVLDNLVPEPSTFALISFATVAGAIAVLRRRPRVNCEVNCGL